MDEPLEMAQHGARVVKSLRYVHWLRSKLNKAIPACGSFTTLASALLLFFL